MTQEEKNQQVVPPAAEQKQPTYPQFNSAADIDARFMQMMERDAERDRAEQERRLRRQQFAQSMGDLGNVLIDTIKMSGGALVTPRDVSARYQQMDAQSQKIYDTYRARMDLLRKYQLDKAAAERARQQALADKAADRAWNEQMQEKKQAFEAEQNKKALEAKKEMNDADNAIRVRVAGINAAADRYWTDKTYEWREYAQENKGGFLLNFGGNVTVPLNSIDGASYYPAIYKILADNNIIPDEEQPRDNWGNLKTPPPKDIKTTVDKYMMTAPSEIKQEVYKMVTGQDKDFGAQEWLDEHRAAQQAQATDTTSAGSLYSIKK